MNTRVFVHFKGKGIILPIIAWGHWGFESHCILGTADERRSPSLIRKKVPIYCWVDRESFPVVAWRSPASNSRPYCDFLHHYLAALTTSFQCKNVRFTSSYMGKCALNVKRAKFCSDTVILLRGKKYEIVRVFSHEVNL